MTAETLTFTNEVSLKEKNSTTLQNMKVQFLILSTEKIKLSIWNILIRICDCVEFTESNYNVQAILISMDYIITEKKRPSLRISFDLIYEFFSSINCRDKQIYQTYYRKYS